MNFVLLVWCCFFLAVTLQVVLNKHCLLSLFYFILIKDVFYSQLFSAAILPLPLKQEEQLSVCAQNTGKLPRGLTQAQCS